ncbi:DUF7844 domain-containing protein [Luteimonas terricola]|uniref:DUF4105 domain-containing protein n=1 Tax=Luteimonas terricola TaxID=645597 RepID=A0ABQ2EA50_9GAMM|nr:DUF4105 domain-containing protein [Luteimonas terricola]GGK02840.1 hypothetical protein GCM10011394_09840 [Luteimonas terricola]
MTTRPVPWLRATAIALTVVLAMAPAMAAQAAFTHESGIRLADGDPESGLRGGDVHADPRTDVALRIELADALSESEAAATRALIDDTLSRLPPRWQAQEASLRLAWRDDLPGHVHGRIRGDRIALSRVLLQGILPADQAPAIADGRSTEHVDVAGGQGTDMPPRAAVAALLHELAHHRDRTHGLSRDPRLLDLAGWQVRPLWPGRGRDNAFSARSPDAYELHSPAEFVAVNLEHFLLDPGYACRRPALHAHFAAHFGWAPDATDCAATLPYVDAGVLADADAPSLLEIDPARVVAVDYLLAGDGEAMMSRWGHSMLRLVICAPGRAPGPDCRLDLEHHRVLSFRAFVDDLQLSSWHGLTGGYPSRLFVLPLQQVVDEYARVELRPLDSIPLRLSAGEIRGLLERAARVHWSYDGRYRFIGNNCAVETWKLLHDGLPRVADAGLASITPKGLLRRLRRAGLVDDARVPADADEALRLGYRFEPWSTYYQSLYDTARERLALGPVDVEEWLRMAAVDRAPWLQRADMRASAALLLLEEAALRREEQHARDALKRLAFRAGGAGSARDEGSEGGSAAAVTAAADGGLLPLLAEALREGGALASPSGLLSLPGYGLPQAAEREQARSGAGERAARLRALDARLHATARDWLPPADRASLEQAEANIAALGARLRELHEAGGGLAL